MSETSSLLPSGNQFWSRPEGRVGLVVAACAVIGGAVFFGSAIGDFLVHALDNTLHLVITLTALFALLAMIADKQLRMMVFYLYRSLMRYLTGLFINIDPIGILKTYKDRMVGKLNEMGESLASLKGQRLKVLRLNEENDRALDKELRLVEQAQKVGDTRTQALEGRQIGRLQTSKQRYSGDLNRLTILINVMDRYYGLCSDTVTDMDREIQYRIDERGYSQQSRKLVRGAMAILKGLPEKDLYDDSMRALEQQYTQAIGEVENFLDVTKDILSKADLQDSADSQKAMELLDNWQKKNATVLLGGVGAQITKADIITQAKQISAA